ncbi:MAG TPA: hypothetical protein PK691_10665, partial [Thermomicrobiales bacterium]|nr:hypothetical protein [Thermomicrobiales bacterium]
MSAQRAPETSRKDSSSYPGPMMMGRGRGPGQFGAPVEKARNFKRTLRRLATYLQPYWTQLGLVIAFAITSTAFSIVSPRILGNITNHVVAGYFEGKAYDHLVARLPAGTEIPPGTTGADLLAQLPPDVRQ